MLDKLKSKLASGPKAEPQYVQSSPSAQPQYVQSSAPPQPVYYQQPPVKSHEINAVTPATVLALVATILLCVLLTRVELIVQAARLDERADAARHRLCDRPERCLARSLGLVLWPILFGAAAARLPDGCV